jgi:hypothetical protein
VGGGVAGQFLLSYQENLFRADMYICQITFYENTEAFFCVFLYYPIIFSSIQVLNKNKIYPNIATNIPALFRGIFG